MDLMDLLKSAGGDNSVGQLASKVGLGSADTSKLMASLTPALMGSLAKGASGSGLTKALLKGDHDRYIDNPDLMSDDDTRRDGNKILGHILGSKDESRRVAAEAASETGIDPGLIKKALPLLATLAMGAMAKKSAKGTDSGGLGSLLGMAKKFF